jgi:hypothetical protein
MASSGPGDPYLDLRQEAQIGIAKDIKKLPE